MPATPRTGKTALHSDQGVPLSEFAARRNALLKSIKGSVGLVLAGEADAHADTPYRPHRHFEYLTGVTDEPGAALLLDPTNPVEARRSMLFLKPLNPELEKWDGYRAEIGKALRDRTGMKAVFRLDKLAMFLGEAARRTRRLACLHPLALHTQPVSADLHLFRLVAERVPGTAIEDRSDVLAVMRASKSRTELAMMQRAIDITARGFAEVFKAIRPGMNEFDVQETIEHSYRTQGARALAFGTIAGAGTNSTVLHYRANNQPLTDGDLVCIDSGAKWCGYSADITRTVPVSGRFTKRQREVYEVVLGAELAAIKATRAGARLSQIDAAARTVISRAGYGDHFIHGIGHHLGLDTHDIPPAGDAPLRVGAVITIEPGIYIPDEKIGIRIEDDVVITKTGCTVLSKQIPKSVEAIERAMRAS